MCSARSTVNKSGDHSWGFCGGRLSRKANWSGVNIAAMVVGFVFFWPIGLFILYWILTGRNAQELPPAARAQWSKMFGGTGMKDSESDNIVFQEYQQTQYDRISEIKGEIKERARRFASFRDSAKRRADQDEFNQFMASSPVQVDS